MKKIIFSLIILIGIIILHNLILDNSEKIASDYAIPYQEISDEEAYSQLLNGRYGAIYREHASKSSISTQKFINYRKYVSQYVAPIQSKIEFAANISFSIIYMISTLFLVKNFYRWIRSDKGIIIFVGLKKFSYFPINLLSRLGLKKLLLNHQLKLTEKEFLRVKNLFDNGLITEEEFLTKKREIKTKITNDNLLNKKF